MEHSQALAMRVQCLHQASPPFPYHVITSAAKELCTPIGGPTMHRKDAGK